MTKLQCLVGKHFSIGDFFFSFVFIDWWYHDIQTSLESLSKKSHQSFRLPSFKPRATMVSPSSRIETKIVGLKKYIMKSTRKTVRNGKNTCKRSPGRIFYLLSVWWYGYGSIDPGTLVFTRSYHRFWPKVSKLSVICIHLLAIPPHHLQLIYISSSLTVLTSFLSVADCGWQLCWISNRCKDYKEQSSFGVWTLQSAYYSYYFWPLVCSAAESCWWNLLM